MKSYSDVIQTGVILTLCVACILATTREEQKDTDEVWLSDMIDYDYMGDAPAEGSDFCPPVPSVLPKGSCQRKVCVSDQSCAEEDGKCCYNGCVYTCLYTVTPSSFFDWKKEPRRRLSSGRSWLVDSSETMNDVEPCSTTPVDADEDPLLCPHGYICSIEETGNSKKGIPNRGRCVHKNNAIINSEIATQRPWSFDRNQALTRKERVCEERRGFLILEGARVHRKGKMCLCRRGKLICHNTRKQH